MNAKIDMLLNAVNDIYPGKVITRVSGEQTGELHVDRVAQEILGDRLLIELAEGTESDFLFGNELLKMLLTLNGVVPQIFFALTFQDDILDQQLIQIATRMHRTVVHTITYRELKKQDVLTADTVTAYLAGVKSELTAENGELDDESLWRLLVMLDALVFADASGADFSELATLYPLAYTAATQLVSPILTADLKQSRHIRRQITQLFAGVDDTLKAWGKPTVNAKEYVTVTSVFSKRQLELPVSQVFTIFHSEMTDFQTKKTAYVGLGQVDSQNSFVITKPDDQDSAAFFKALYKMTVSDLFKQLALPYINRK
ncbi:nitrate ABC transporter ATPase [Leuconostoc sp. MS02]|uniref:Nitrate ABC transporter ATPase n=1 Tax=Leuconostoc aquikimchii TaxID=3236804 RepID=A0ABV3S2N8_9LACO